MATLPGMAGAQRSRICSTSSYICIGRQSTCAVGAEGLQAGVQPSGSIPGSAPPPHKHHSPLARLAARTCSVDGAGGGACSRAACGSGSSHGAGCAAAMAATAAAAAAAGEPAVAAAAGESGPGSAAVRTAAGGGAVGDGSMPWAASSSRRRVSSDSSHASFSFWRSLQMRIGGGGADRDKA